MSSGHRVATIALGLALLALPALAQESRPRTIEGNPQVSSERSKAPEGSDGEITPEIGYVQRFLAAIERLEPAIRELITKEDAAAALEERERDHADLRAQESMAVWAFWMFAASVASVLLTAVGVGLILRTLYHTKRAADYARDMVVEARSTTVAAERAVAETKRIGEAQVRAYLSVTSCGIERLEGSFANLRMMVKNSGQSPAKFVKV
jgi:hypothetical protein